MLSGVGTSSGEALIVAVVRGFELAHCLRNRRVGARGARGGTGGVSHGPSAYHRARKSASGYFFPPSVKLFPLYPFSQPISCLLYFLSSFSHPLFNDSIFSPWSSVISNPVTTSDSPTLNYLLHDLEARSVSFFESTANEQKGENRISRKCVKEGRTSHGGRSIRRQFLSDYVKNGGYRWPIPWQSPASESLQGGRLGQLGNKCSRFLLCRLSGRLKRGPFFCRNESTSRRASETAFGSKVPSLFSFRRKWISSIECLFLR